MAPSPGPPPLTQQLFSDSQTRRHNRKRRCAPNPHSETAADMRRKRWQRLCPDCLKGFGILRDPDTGEVKLFPCTCGRWDCPHCADYKLRRSQAMARAGQPEREITLTTRPKPGWSVPAACRWIRKCLAKLVKILRKTHGQFEYFSCLELHASGWPHLHKGTYIDQHSLAKHWKHVSGGWIVHIKKVNDTSAHVRHVCKYVTKTAPSLKKAGCDLQPITFSKGWLPDDWRYPEDPDPSWEFIGIVHLPKADLFSALEELNCDIDCDPQRGSSLFLRSRAPPDRRALDRLMDMGSYGERELAAIIDQLFTRPCGPALPNDELKAGIGYYAAHASRFYAD